MKNLFPKITSENIQRFFRIYINPPKERGIILDPLNLTEEAFRESKIDTKAQPKQVVYNNETKEAFVSCMEGRTLQVFKIQDKKIKFETEISFEDQCVEVALHNDLLFVTTTNFNRPPSEPRNRLWLLDQRSKKIISSVDTGGNWSKLIAVRPQGNELLISNWHSHDISVIDITDPENPNLKQILKWGEVPRGIAFLPNGNSAIVTGFYSGNIGVLIKNNEGWESSFTSKPFDAPNYSGNMRHVLITSDAKTAIISNLGRNLLHFWNIENRTFEKSILVGKSPNSIDFISSDKVAVSCRDSSYVYLVDTNFRKVVGRSQKTGAEPTGLCKVGSGFLVTNFKENSMELYSIKS